MGKLVRDRIPDIIELNEGRKAKTSFIGDNKILKAAFKKLTEESAEAKKAGLVTNFRYSDERKKAVAEELGDCLDAIDLICFHLEIPAETVQQARRDKNNFKGGFSRRISLDE